MHVFARVCAQVDTHFCTHVDRHVDAPADTHVGTHVCERVDTHVDTQATDYAQVDRVPRRQSWTNSAKSRLTYMATTRSDI